MSSRLIPALAIPAALLFALTACATPGSGDGGSGDGGSGGGGGDDAGSATGIGCLTDRTWSLDLNDLVGQLGAQMAGSGMPLVEASASGTQTVEFSSDGTAVAAINSTFVVTVDSNGLPLTITQTHTGTPSGAWSDAGDGAVTFDEWDDAGYTIDNEISMDGTAVDMPIELPPNSFGGSTMTYECSGSSLTTTVPENTFTYRWSTED